MFFHWIDVKEVQQILLRTRNAQEVVDNGQPHSTWTYIHKTETSPLITCYIIFVT